MFYPADTKDAAFIKWLSTFAVGYLIKPFGALLFGHLGDRFGRKFSFICTLSIMGISTFLMGCLPTYNNIGAAAGYLLFVLRLLQGLAHGGEYGAAAVFIGEHAPAGKRGYYTGFIQLTPCFGMALSLFVTIICNLAMGQKEFSNWGWRIPFFISILLVAASLYIRFKLDESPVFEKAIEDGYRSKAPLIDTFCKWENLKLVLNVFFGCCVGIGVTFYFISLYTLYYLQTSLLYDNLTAWGVLCAALGLATPIGFYFSSLSDRVGRKWIMVVGLALGVVSWYPIFVALRALGPYVDPNATLLVASASYNPYLSSFLVFIMIALCAIAYGPIGAFMVELFPTNVRYTSISVPFHTAGVISGFTPLIAFSLTAKTGNMYAGVWFPIVAVALSVVVMIAFTPETYMVDIEHVGKLECVEIEYQSDRTETSDTIVEE
ncbi:hypothetical protein HDV01_003449 [Terramyces sp. JEL0728]|nr:hypothetical protein HDV01_003449 [Terramyces sp. JEL0728]